MSDDYIKAKPVGSAHDRLNGPKGKGVAGDEHAAAAAEAVAAVVAGEDVNFQDQGWSHPEAYDYSNEEAPFDGNAVVYHWDGEEGDIGPAYPELEILLFGPEDDRKIRRGIDFIDTK